MTIGLWAGESPAGRRCDVLLPEPAATAAAGASRPHVLRSSDTQQHGTCHESRHAGCPTGAFLGFTSAQTYATST